MNSAKALAIKKLVVLLKIPVDDINYVTPTLIELFYNGFRLGTVATIRDRDETRNNITLADRSSLQLLDWNYIFKQNESTLKTLITTQLNDNTAMIKSSSFRNLIVEFPPLARQFVYKCSFENDAWKVNA
jgi:hypothetical protein